MGAEGQRVISVKSPLGRHLVRPAPASTALIAQHQAYSRHSHPRAETLSLLSDPALLPLYASSLHRLLLSLPAVHQLGRDEWPSVPDFFLRARCSATVAYTIFADFVKSKEVLQKHCSGDLGVLDGRVSVTEVSPAIICLLCRPGMRALRTNICSRMTFLGRWGHLDNWLSEQSSPGTGLGRGPQAVSPGARKRGGRPPEFQTSGSLTAHIVSPVLPVTEAAGSGPPCPGHPFPCLGWLCG